MVIYKNKAQLHNLSLQERLNTKRTPLEQACLKENIDCEAYASKQTTAIEVSPLKDLANKLTFNPLKMPYKHLKAFVIRLLVGSITTLSFLTAQIAQASTTPTLIDNNDKITDRHSAFNTTPTVIYNNGNTINAQPFYPFKRVTSSDLEPIPRYTTKTIKRFPIVSSTLSVGKVKNTKIRSKLPRAICMIGDDDYSKRWLQNKRRVLHASNALCMVVNVDSKQRFESIEARTPSVEFQALNGDMIARVLNIKHYPFLLDKGFISQ